MSGSGDLITRNYTDLRGVDFSNDEGVVSLQRSPDAKNVWKDYKTTQGNCIETRPGYKEIIDFKEKINSFFIFKESLALVHAGEKLYLWNEFPSNQENAEILKDNMNNIKSVMYLFKDSLYINDGKNYLKFDGETLKNVSNEAYVPTTSIGRKPTGGGQLNEDVNLLTGQRINTFLADGKSTEYFLDATNIESVEKVTINDEEITNYTIDLVKGKITFETAPIEPELMGHDNVSVKFTKTISGYLDRILKCTIAKVFDNRIFFSGNPDFKNAIFHSSVNTASYISDLDYYQDGIETPIKALVVGNNTLWALKDENQNNDTIFYHTPTTDSNYGRIYPSAQGNVSIGCYSEAINYDDTILFLSREGLESITNSIESLQIVTHKSSMVDRKLINESNYRNPSICRWQGYLFIAVDNHIYLANNRQMFANNKNYEYEWFYWELKDNITFMNVYEEKLYIGTDNGKIHIFEGTNDNGEEIQSYWTTPRDVFKCMQFLKTSNKRGAIAKMKNIPNSKIRIEVRTNKKDWKILKEVTTKGFSYIGFSYSDFAYSTGYQSYIAFKIKIKKFIDFQLRFSNVGKDKPFGLYSCTLEAFIGSFVKRS